MAGARISSRDLTDPSPKKQSEATTTRLHSIGLSRAEFRCMYNLSRRPIDDELPTYVHMELFSEVMQQDPGTIGAMC